MLSTPKEPLLLEWHIKLSGKRAKYHICQMKQKASVWDYEFEVMWMYILIRIQNQSISKDFEVFPNALLNDQIQ